VLLSKVDEIVGSVVRQKPALLRGLLVCGVLSSPFYLGLDLVAGLTYDGYDFIDQQVSELSAIGAPTRPFWLVLGPVYQLLMVLFGVGVRVAAGRRRSLRIGGALIIAYGVVGFAAPLTPMHAREYLATNGPALTEHLHLVATGVAVLLLFTAIGFAAAAFGTPFRVYSIITVVVSVSLGARAGTMAPQLEANLPTPWMGVLERASIAVMMAWVVVFAIAMLRRSARLDRGSLGDDSSRGRSGR